MIFGLPLPPFAGRCSKALQIEALKCSMAERIIDHEGFTPDFLRKNDALVIVDLLPFADRPEELAMFYEQIWQAKATLKVVSTGAKYDGPNSMADLITDWAKEKRRDQTAAARAKRPKPPQGPRKLKDPDQFKRDWRNTELTKADLARCYGVAWKTINEWGRYFKLPARL